jgi:hypothetical protein
MYVCSRQLTLQVFPPDSCPPPMLLALLHRDASPAIAERSSWFLLQQRRILSALRLRKILGYLLTLSNHERPVMRTLQRTYLQMAFPTLAGKLTILMA